MVKNGYHLLIKGGHYSHPELDIFGKASGHLQIAGHQAAGVDQS